MNFPVLIDTMPVSTSNRYSTYSTLARPTSSTYRTTSSTYGRYDSSSSSSPLYKARPLPAGRGPLDTTGKHISNYSLRNKTPTNLARNGPLKVDYSSTATRVPDTYSTFSRRRTSSSEVVPTGRLSGRRSSSMVAINDLDNLHISESSSSLFNSRYDKDYSTVSPRRTTYYRDDDMPSSNSRNSSRTGRISASVEPEMPSSSSYVPRSRISREPSPMRERDSTPTRRYSVDTRDSHAAATSKGVTRQSSNSSLVSKCANTGKVGLRNLGNTCFMNSVIQCLSNTQPLLEYCLKEDYIMDMNVTTSSMKGALMKAYVNLMQSMWKANEHYVSPNAFKTQIQRFAPRFMGYAQQDSQEFLRYLLEGLHEDVNKVTTKPKPIILEDDKLERKSDNDKSYEYWRTYLNFDNSRIVEIFVGQLKSELKFRECGHNSVTFDPFWDLSLPIPKNRSDVSLDDCFRLFMKEEHLQDDAMCTKCKQKRTCTKGFSIQKFPQILVIHLKRFSQERFGRKLTTGVDYPTSAFDLSEYSSERGTVGVKYRLYAVSNHSGGVHSGHYTAICKHPYGGEWHNFNDTSVTSGRASQAVSSEGYILFYEQIKGS